MTPLDLARVFRLLADGRQEVSSEETGSPKASTALWDSPARTQSSQTGCSNRHEQTTQTVHQSPDNTRPKVRLSGPTHRGPPAPRVALSRVLDLNSEELLYHTSEMGQ